MNSSIPEAVLSLAFNRARGAASVEDPAKTEEPQAFKQRAQAGAAPVEAEDQAEEQQQAPEEPEIDLFA